MSCSKALKPSCSKLHRADIGRKGRSKTCNIFPTARHSQQQSTRASLPDVHKHVAEEAPHLCAVAGVVHQGALHEVGLIRLQDPLVQHDAVAHEHDNLQRTQAKEAGRDGTQAGTAKLLKDAGLAIIRNVQLLPLAGC